MRTSLFWKGEMACVKKRKGSTFSLLIMTAVLALFQGTMAPAQTVQPVIVEYTGKAAGRFQVTNTSLAPMAVVLEPKSFSIGSDGKGKFRALDPTIHVDLSTMSFRLEPQQSYYIFYKAQADTLPAWFTVYAVFSPVAREDGLKLRIMLPHTVYLYQKKPVNKDAIRIQQAVYRVGTNTVVCDIDNQSSSLVRVQEVHVVGGKESVQADGFPLLPGSPRHLEISWKQPDPPSYLLLRFPHFVLKEPLSIKNE
jgi:ABC-type transport system substrate-binding protein